MGDPVYLHNATGEAEIRDSVTMLHATVDVATLSAGVYHLEVRRAGGAWRRFPARLQQ